MDDGFTIQGAVMEILQDLAQSATSFAPRLVTALIAVFIGWLIAALLERLLKGLLVRIKLDAMMEKAGLTSSLRRVGLRDGVSHLLPRVLFWLALLIFVEAAARQVGLDSIADGITAMFAFLPNVISAAGVLLIGLGFAQFLSRAIATYGRESGLSFARAMGNAVSGVVLLVVVVIALAQLRIDTRILNQLAVVTFAGLALGFGLTFGLGTRDTTRNIIAGFYARRLFRSGQTVEMAGERGTLQSITTTQTVLETDGRTIALPNTIFLDQAVQRLET